MPNDLNFDKLIKAAKKIGGHKTKKAAVTAALEEYVRRRQMEEVISAFGTIDFDPEYNYKVERKSRRVLRGSSNE